MFALSGQKWGNSVAGDPSGPVYWSVDFEGDLDFDSDRYSEQDFEDTLREAFQTWEDVSGLDLEQADASNPADITVGTQFLAGSTVGQASSSFRNTGGELGEYTSSRITFDTEVEWSPEGGAGTVDFFAVALHEIGHSIGLGHVNDPTQILNPVISTDELGDGDIEGVQALYGANADAPDPDPEPTPDPEPEPTPDPEPEPDPEPTPVPEPEPEPAPEPDSEDEADPDVTEAPVAEDDGGSNATGVIVGAAAIAGLGAAGAFSGLLAGGLGVAGIAVIGVGLGVVLVASGGGGDDAPAEGDEETSLITQDATVEDAAGLALIDSLDDPEEEFDLSEMPTIPIPDEFCLTCGFETCSGCGQDEEESSDFLV